jgi:hypothetical protein
LRAQEFRVDVSAAALRAGLQQRRRRILVDVARCEVNEQILLFHTDRKRRLSISHNSPLFMACGQLSSGIALRATPTM